MRRHRRRARQEVRRARSAPCRAGARPAAADRAAGDRRAARASARPASGDRVGERHLARLVDEQHVDALHVRAREEPCVPAATSLPAASAASTASFVARAWSRRCGVLTVVARLLDDPHRDPSLGPPIRPVEQMPITLWLVGGDPTRRPAATSSTIMLAPVRLARAGRPLDREQPPDIAGRSASPRRRRPRPARRAGRPAPDRRRGGRRRSRSRAARNAARSRRAAGRRPTRRGGAGSPSGRRRTHHEVRHDRGAVRGRLGARMRDEPPAASISTIVPGAFGRRIVTLSSDERCRGPGRGTRRCRCATSPSGRERRKCSPASGSGSSSRSSSVRSLSRWK